MKRFTNTLYTSFAFLFLLPLVSMLSDRCASDNCTPWSLANHTYLGAIDEDAPVDSIPVQYFNSAWVAPGDLLRLEFHCQPKRPELLASQSSRPFLFGNNANIIHSPDARNYVMIKVPESPAGDPFSGLPNQIDSFVVYFPEIPFKFTFYIYPQDPPTSFPSDPTTYIPFRAGDTNGDGQINMLDMAPIAAGMYHHTVKGMATRTQPEVFDGPDGRLFVKAWNEYWQWGGLVNEQIDFALADCNLDGEINLDDLEVVKAGMTPIDIPLFLRDFVNDLEFTVERDPSLPIRPVPAVDDQPGIVQIPYTVLLNDPNWDPANALPDSFPGILGIVHRRPLTETSCGTILRIQPGFENSFLEDDASRIGYHEHWRGLDLHLDEICDLEDGESIGVVDIGLFSTSEVYQLAHRSKIMDCIVDIDDIGLAFDGSNCPIVQHDLEGFIFFIDGEGRISVRPANCSRSEYILTENDRCFQQPEIIIRDNLADAGMVTQNLQPRNWTSPDIWIGSQGNSSVTKGSQVSVSMRALNQSCHPITNATATLYYKANSSGNEGDPNQGGLQLIGSCDLGTIGSLEFSTCSLNWLVPNSLPNRFTLLAIVSGDGDEFELSPNPNPNLVPLVAGSNQVAALRATAN